MSPRVQISARRASDDRGVSVIIVALLLTVLLTASAFAVDVGAAYTERRHDQNTVDAAVMSGAVEAVIGGGVIDDVVAEVRDKVDITLGRPVTAQAWEDCTDADQLHYTTRDLQVGNPTIDPVTDCISFSIAFERVRVKVPDQPVQAVFGPALGFDPFKTNASAEAEVVSGGGSAPPFVALATATQGDFVCLRTSSNPQPQTLMDGNGPGVAATPGTRPDPCDDTQFDTSSENFGTLAPFRYLDGCTQQKNDTEVAISLGIDHIIGYFEDGYDPATSVERVDGDATCTVAFPNTFWIEPGFNAAGLRCGLITLKNEDTCNGEPARFHQGDFVQDTYTFADEKMDNAAPWEFLRPATDLYDEFKPEDPNAPWYDCVALAASRPGDDFKLYGGIYGAFTEYNGMSDIDWDHYDRYDHLIRCLEGWAHGDPELFDEKIGTSSRFAFIPQVYETSLDVSKVHIEGFLPSYMYRLYQSVPSEHFGYSPPAPACDPVDGRTNVPFYIHDAGMQLSCAYANQNVDRLASIIFACGMVPDSLCNKESGNPPDAGQDIYEFRLVQ